MGRLTPEDVCPILSALSLITNTRSLSAVFLIQGDFFSHLMVISCSSFSVVRALVRQELRLDPKLLYSYQFTDIHYLCIPSGRGIIYCTF